MPTRDHWRLFLLTFGSIFFVMSVVQLVRFFRQPADIWWTPTTMRMPLGESRDRVQIYVAGVLLQEHLTGGRLLLAGERGTAQVNETDVDLRFNNWDRVRSQQIPALLSYAAGAGAAGIALLFAALGCIPPRAGGADDPRGGRS
jgi:hypothetical protein